MYWIFSFGLHVCKSSICHCSYAQTCKCIVFLFIYLITWNFNWPLFRNYWSHLYQIYRDGIVGCIEPDKILKSIWEEFLSYWNHLILEKSFCCTLLWSGKSSYNYFHKENIEIEHIQASFSLMFEFIWVLKAIYCYLSNIEHQVLSFKHQIYTFVISRAETV